MQMYKNMDLDGFINSCCDLEENYKLPAGELDDTFGDFGHFIYVAAGHMEHPERMLPCYDFYYEDKEDSLNIYESDAASIDDFWDEKLSGIDLDAYANEYYLGQKLEHECLEELAMMGFVSPGDEQDMEWD